LQARLAQHNLGAGRAFRDVRVEFGTRAGVQFIACVQNGERFDVFAANR
jgi:hypothetical protein